MKVICFGAGGGAKKLYGRISEKYEIIAFTDNDSRKWEKQFIFGIPVLEPRKCIMSLEWDLIVITSAPGLETIRKQLSDMGIAENKIVTFYVENELEGRKVFLKRLAESMEYDTAAECAEAGVFEGDFARYINEFFPNRKLHLFDTFEGFVARDIEKEQEFSAASKGDYGNTSVELVMGKMLYPQNIIIHKGYFPDTAGSLCNPFCFVNLDLDLYEPTYNGLVFFEDKMVENGVILVHDYFSDNFRGPRAAVDRFLRDRKKLQKYPIGDGISIMLVGFGRETE